VDFLFIILMIILLFIFGYAQLQKGVVKTIGRITLGDHDDGLSLNENV